MMIPSLPGRMFYRAVKRTKPRLCQRFIFTTGFKRHREIEEFIRRISGLMLWKPFETIELMDAMTMILQKTGG
jgi:hypothetical protein